MLWQKGKKHICKPKYELAIDMFQWAIDRGFPRGIVLADSWFGSGPFVKGLKGLKLSYVIEIKSTLTVRERFALYRFCAGPGVFWAPKKRGREV